MHLTSCLDKQPTIGGPPSRCDSPAAQIRGILAGGDILAKAVAIHIMCTGQSVNAAYQLSRDKLAVTTPVLRSTSARTAATRRSPAPP
jgi:hypothetical protein